MGLLMGNPFYPSTPDSPYTTNRVFSAIGKKFNEINGWFRKTKLIIIVRKKRQAEDKNGSGDSK